MFGYKVNVGIFSKFPTSLSDIDFLDINSPYFFGEIEAMKVPLETGPYYSSDANDKVLNDTLNNLGEYFNYTYGIEGGAIITSEQVEFGRNWWPSFFLAYPNTLNKVLSRSINIAIHFIALNRIYIVSDISPRGSFVGVVNGNNIESLLSLPSTFFNTYTLNTANSITTFIGWTSCKIIGRDDFTSVNSWAITRSNFVSQGRYANQYLTINYADNSIADALSLFWSDYAPPDWEDSSNPYEPGGDSGEGGGGGSFDDESDFIPDSTLPTLSSSNTGFTRIYNPTLSQVQELAKYLWTDDSVIETIWNHIKQYFENPMEAIIGFNLVPVKVPDGGTQNFALMYIDTGVSMTVAANQFVDVDCGTLTISPYYGSALDYSPYTKISCFLPFIGTVQLNVDEVMDTTLTVRYRVDICSGSCVAKILVNGNVLYQYSGHCAIPIPIAAADFSSYVSAAISVAKLAIGAAVGGGMGAIMAGSSDPVQQTNQVVTRTTTTTETARNPSTGRQITTGTKSTVETVERPQDTSSTQASFDGLSPMNISNTVGQIMSSKPHVEHSGSFSGNTGYLGVRRPYVIIQRPNMCMPTKYQQFNGFPCMITLSLGDCTGFTQVQQVQLTGMTATNPEQSEILQFLKSGVVL